MKRPRERSFGAYDIAANRAAFAAARRLAVAGEAGVGRALQLPAHEFRTTMALVGARP